MTIKVQLSSDNAHAKIGAETLSAADIPTADELGAEFEQFLRDQNGS